MKKKFLLLMSIFVISLSACSDNAESANWKFSELPETAQTFVTTYFNQYMVNKVKKNKKENERGSVYEVTLQKNGLKVALSSISSGIKIEFDRNGEWTEIESLTDNGSIPADILELLPVGIVEYIERNYPNKAPEEIERKPYGYKIELVNDKELLFDKNGEILSDSQSGNNNETGSETASDKMNEFIKTHFPGYTIAYVKNEKDNGQRYKKVYLKEGYKKSYKIVFDSNDNWVEVEGDDDIYLLVPESIMQLLPGSISDYIKTNYSTGYITEVEKERSMYKVEVVVDRNDFDLYFDLSGNFLRMDK